MSIPTLSPIQTQPTFVLPATGNVALVASALPFGVYANSPAFLTGASNEVSFVYRMLGGSVLDIELTQQDVFAAYESAVLEYGYLVNLYQAKNSLSSLLGSATGTFDSNGQLVSGSSLSGSNIALKFPRFGISYAKKIYDMISYESGFGGSVPYYTSSIDLVPGVQIYDLQQAVSSSATSGGVDFASAFNGTKVRISKVWFKSPAATWRFFGYYGGLGVVGNMGDYGVYADQTAFQAVPVWDTKLQGAMFESSLYTRASHYSYELKNNKVRLYPAPTTSQLFNKLWFEFSIEPGPLDESIIDVSGTLGGTTGINGINNLNSLPFENIPFENINSIGQNWIKKYALALCKEILGQIRGKFDVLPIPGDSVKLNADSLLAQAKDELAALKEELKTILTETTYQNLAEVDASLIENARKLKTFFPKSIFIG